MPRQLLPLILLVALLLSACGPTTPNTEVDTRLKVVATTQHLADAVANIAQDRILLIPLFGPGSDPHSYLPTEGDINTFQQADLIFYNGLLLEAQLERVLEQIDQRSTTRVVAVAEQLNPQRLLPWEGELGYDPHVWNDPILWIEAVAVIRDTLSELDPDYAAEYAANADAFVVEIEAVHAYTLAQVERIPSEQRLLVTAHDAFNYYARTYDLEVAAVQGMSTTSEASAADIQAVATLLVERQVPAIFVESTISPRTIEAVVAAARAGGQEVRIGGELFADAMGQPATPEGTYLGMLRHNIDTIVAGLLQ